jgi:phage-related protein
MAEFEVIFYEKENGECPAEEFILSLDVKMRAKMLGLLELLEEKGTQLREPYSKAIDDGIFEIRCKIGNNISRVLYFFYYEGKIILTNGFVKKTQKTPPKEIKRAKKYRADFKERMGKA